MYTAPIYLITCVFIHILTINNNFYPFYKYISMNEGKLKLFSIVTNVQQLKIVSL